MRILIAAVVILLSLCLRYFFHIIDDGEYRIIMMVSFLVFVSFWKPNKIANKTTKGIALIGMVSAFLIGIVVTFMK